jgi:hypothetical protein
MTGTEQNRANLVEALRSGKYIQGRSRLRQLVPGVDGDDESNDVVCQYCCLGVAADLLVKQGKYQWKATTGSTVNPWGCFVLAESDGAPIREADGSAESITGSVSYLPDVVAKQYGFTSHLQYALSRRNDQGESFDTIASAIEMIDLRVHVDAIDMRYPHSTKRQEQICVWAWGHIGRTVNVGRHHQAADITELLYVTRTSAVFNTFPGIPYRIKLPLQLSR